MKRFLKSIIVIFLFLAGTAFFSISHAGRRPNLARLLSGNSDHLKKNPNEREVEIVLASPINSQGRKRGLPLGLWGGEHISIEVTEQGATVEYDCAHAAINQRIILDRRGRFDVSGMQVLERGGPVRQNDQLAGYPVRFTGEVNGKRMKLSVRKSAARELIGTFTLVYGNEARLRKCK
jgi:hypothetical protein